MVNKDLHNVATFPIPMFGRKRHNVPAPGHLFAMSGALHLFSASARGGAADACGGIAVCELTLSATTADECLERSTTPRHLPQSS